MTEVVSHLPAILRPYYLAEVIVRSAHFLHALGSRPALVITARRWSPAHYLARAATDFATA